ncbi:uncharacterized protein LOC121425486 [Lytechinus variegatus]|uniref:uncharacterized protein LOC121425486 n=1 Tax=Lytechinus variegatus TaxID=7654 RepID=UPI001BB2BC00|nr:uncharacterized protein LOC121425486 [Lytechinus variegatus]
MCTVYDVFKQVHRRPSDFKSRDSFPSLDLADWDRVRESISRKSCMPYNGLEWLNDNKYDNDDDDDDGDGGAAESDYSSDDPEDDPVERVRLENAASVPNYSRSAKTRTQSAFSWIPSKALDKQTFEIRRAIARQSISRGITFDLPASQTKLSINSEFQPELYGLFTKKFRHEHDLWRERRGGTSPRYLSQPPKLKPPPPPKRFIPEITTHSPRELFMVDRNPKIDEQPTFRSSDLHSGNVTLPTDGMPTVRMRRKSLTGGKTSLDLQEDTVNLWRNNTVLKAKDAFKKSILKWKAGAKKEEEDYLEESKRAEVLAWLDKMKLN